MLKNNILKIFIVAICCFVVQTNGFAVENQIPVSTSYSDALNQAQQQISQPQQVQQTQQMQNNQVQLSSTPAHDAVTGKLTEEQLYGITAPSQEIQNVAQQVKKEQQQTKIQRGFVNVVFKFLLAMVWVAISSVFIFIILLSYKKLILKGKPLTPTYETKEHSLTSPKNFQEAIKLFLDKTKWN